MKEKFASINEQVNKKQSVIESIQTKIKNSNLKINEIDEDILKAEQNKEWLVKDLNEKRK